jgi:hypothetical protein
MKMKIRQWGELEDDFRDAVILGNGASIAVAPGFGYSKLLKAAREDGLITPRLEKLFDYIEVPDFELALTMLWHAHHVNLSLGVDERRTTRSYERLRTALVETIQKHHVPYADIYEQLPTLAAYMKQFSTVVSLNYDLIVYWAMMAGKREYGSWFKDAFLHGKYCHDWSWMRTPFNAEGTTMVFYPHGSLALATDLNGEERKLEIQSFPIGKSIRIIKRNLLDEITKQWNDASVTPLFVAEGTSRQKIAAINRSTYLRNVFDQALPSLGESVAVFGWSASENDRHILEQVLRKGQRLAFSVTRNGGVAAAEARCVRLLSRIRDVKLRPKRRARIDVQFYWADSDGAWGSAA